jgi:antitoxin component YwqK of YwqJK toxin-antitoxin module
MVQFNLFFVALISLSIFNACNNKGISFERKNIDGKIFIAKKTYDKKGNIHTEELLDKDSVRNGYYKEYNIGKIKDSGNYNNGKKEGTWYYWDLGGDLIKTENWFSGKQFGEQIEYYNKTTNVYNQLYKYSFFNIEGQKIFESKFDLDGKLLTSEGTPIYCTYNTANIHPGGTYELICFLGVPKKFDWKFSVEEIEKEKRKALFKQDFTNSNLEELPFAKRFYHTKKYLSKGTYEWRLFLQINSPTRDTLFKGPITLSVSVQ